MRRRTTFCYELHPILAAFYDQWSSLCAPALPLSFPRISLLSLQTSVMFYRTPSVPALASDPNNSPRQIIGPMLPVFYWDAPSSPPGSVRWLKSDLDDDAVLTHLVAEWMRWIVMTADPLLAEQCRLVFSQLLDQPQRVGLFGVRALSQRAWGQRVGLTREQLARGAAQLKRLSIVAKKTLPLDNAPALDFFKDRYG